MEDVHLIKVGGCIVVDSRDKGTRGETIVRDLLRKLTGLQWERVPMSGALDPVHGMKADLYVPNCLNLFCVEVKNYKDDHLTSKLLTGKTPQLIDWWIQTIRESEQVKKKPLLIFKFDRSKIFVAFKEMPNSSELDFIFINLGGFEIYVSLLENYIKYEQPRFV